jgi:hypothetical protein
MTRTNQAPRGGGSGVRYVQRRPLPNSMTSTPKAPIQHRILRSGKKVETGRVEKAKTPRRTSKYTCRICTDTKPIKAFPKPAPQTGWNPSDLLDIPVYCQIHLGINSDSGPVCKECITGYFVGVLEIEPGRAGTLGCLEPGCRNWWDTSLITRYLLGHRDTLEIYSEALFKANWLTHKDLKYCSTPGCGWGGLTDPHGKGYPQIHCGKCNQRSCMTCNVPWHEGVTCQEYRMKNGEVDDAEQATLTALAKEGYKRCPRCQFAIKKIDGCNSVRCK